VVWRPPGAWLAAAPLLLVLQAAFTAGLGLLLATLQVFVRDTAHVVGVALTLWMFATPLFWVPAPEVLPGIEAWLWLVEANPMHHLLYVWRAGLMGLEPGICFDAPVARSLGLFALWAGAVFALGHTAFVLGSRRFPDEA
jgi:ABC-type polysaccharide/polyol phosphate export permease